ncbi:hypothetical protein E1A91_D03G024000v1 [Gossypium mustelinum]|uniref:Cytochrome P450 n=1 Tax=Gossypium mustelinum TaxID=34275 RepID=A0A5D2VJ41_GOSMU|nr:hypothetical protein E1A91_D03G024000v1 [Gossypium mustelinum]
MAIVVFLVFLLPLSLFLFILLKHGNSNRLPPSPPSLPLIGHLHIQLFDNSAPHIFLSKLSQKYVSSAKMAKEVMKTHDLDFCSRPHQLCSHKLSYNGSDLAFSPYNDYWREMRKICVVHLFSGMQQYRPIREGEVAGLIEKISKLSVDSKPVNLSESMMCLSSTIICRIAFGKRYDEEGAERSRFHELLNESQAIFSSFSCSDFFPYMGWLDRFTGLHSQDILDVLLQTWKDHDFSFDLTIDQIKAILMNVFIGGTDTSSATVIWVMSFLMKNPKCLKKTQAEIRNLVGQKGFVNEDDTRDLTYLKAVIKETFRLQPIAPLLVPRETLRKCNIGGYDIPAKTLVYVNAWAIGKDPETWENPEEFYPERFIGSPIDYKGQHFELIPFGAGRRVCPGMHMGVAVVELALANLLYKFDWEMPIAMSKEDIDFDALPGLATHKKNPLILVARKIYY